MESRWLQMCRAGFGYGSRVHVCVLYPVWTQNLQRHSSLLPQPPFHHLVFYEKQKLWTANMEIHWTWADPSFLALSPKIALPFLSFPCVTGTYLGLFRTLCTFSSTKTEDIHFMPIFINTAVKFFLKKIIVFISNIFYCRRVCFLSRITKINKLIN